MDESLRGHQPAGPSRWKRAAQWAAEHPHTAQALKYQARVKAATAVAAGQPAQAWEHWRRHWDGPRYEYQTCSTFCATMQFQLDLGVAGLKELAPVTAKPLDEHTFYLVERPAASKRRGKCKACGRDVL